MIKSRNDFECAPIILWLNGGPGVSSLYGLLNQWGPQVFKIGQKGLQPNPADLSEFTTVIYLDQPLGAGFSEDPNPLGTIKSSAQAAEDVVAFIKRFRQTQFDGKILAQDLHIAGESYAGHWIPPIMAQILEKPRDEQDFLNVQSLIIGNPWMDAAVQQKASFDLVCDPQLDSAEEWMLSDDECNKAAKVWVGCKERILTCGAPPGCNAVADCFQISSDKYWKVGLSQTQSFVFRAPIRLLMSIVRELI